jgi:hypothetical protein
MVIGTTMDSFKEHLTDPRKHDPSDFTYIVHGLMTNGFLSDEMDSRYLERKLENLKSPGLFYRSSMVGVMPPEKVEKLGWGNQKIFQVGTYGNCGFVMDYSDVAENVIKIAWNSDIGSPNDQAKLGAYVAKHQYKIKYPFTLLTQTVGEPSIKYNELIAEGHEKTKIGGVFYRGPTKGKALGVIENLEGLLGESLPLVELPLPKADHSLKSELERSVNRLRYESEIVQAHFEFNESPLERLQYQTYDFPSYRRTTAKSYPSNL